jgi:hypothetical protein
MIPQIFSFIAGFVDNADKHSLANISTHWNVPTGVLRGRGKTDLWKKLEAENLVSDPL